MNYIDPKGSHSVKSRGFMSRDVQKAESDRNAIWDNELDASKEDVKLYSKAELEEILGAKALRPSKISVKRLFVLQAIVTAISCIAWSAKGKPLGLDSSAISALLGGLVAIVPAGLFAMRAKVLAGKTSKAAVSGASVFALVTGELIKIIATIAMFFLVIVLYPQLDWLPLLLTYVLVLKCYVLAWFLK